ncbi:MAG TPA: hypothetical protein PK129_11070 [Cellvibrionaceae bacterium]|nr:hypothetical protein [Cellvibrionaceae bacterium]
MKTAAIFIASLLFTSVASADGVPLVNGRYTGGELVVLKLSKAQKATVEHYSVCHLENFKTMNVYTPYVFELTPEQSSVLKSKVGFAPKFFEVFETYRGFNDAGPHWNLALRFSEDEIEIPVNLLLTDKKAGAAHQAQGWRRTNPCFPKLRVY